jgi:uncharacterized membrane protein
VSQQKDDYLHRVELVTDGVFAIAITLLAIDLKPPEGWDGGMESFLAGSGGRLAAYAVGFAIIAVYWLSHRRSFARLVRADFGVAALNFLMLALVCLMPAATALLWEGKLSLGAVELYVGLVSLIGVAHGLVWLWAWIAGHIDPAVTTGPRLFNLFCVALLPGSCAGLSIWSSLHETWIGYAGVAAIGVLVAFVGRRLRREPAAAAAAA